jgi:hypothetical protein
MENVILDDSPLAEFLEGMRALAAAYEAATAHHNHRAGPRGLPSGITHYVSHTRCAELRAARTVDAAVEDTGPAPTATADPRAAWLDCAHAHRVLGRLHPPRNRARTADSTHRKRSIRGSAVPTTSDF